MDYKNTYIGRVLNGLSQFGNTLIGGNPDVSISARIGYNAIRNTNNFWLVCEWIVDTTFKPVDGKSHCKNAYISDKSEDYSLTKGSFIGLVFMVLLMLIFCIPLSIIFYAYSLFK